MIPCFRPAVELLEDRTAPAAVPVLAGSAIPSTPAGASLANNPTVPSTDAVVLAGLTSGTPNVALPAGVEVPVRQNIVYAPGSPNFNSNLAVLQPVLPTPYTYWEVDLMAAPITVQNNSSTPGTLLVNVYSSNAYVYQQEVTIQPDSYFPVTFGAMALGVVSNAPGAPGMPISITMRAEGANMTAILDTQGPTDLRPNHPSYDSVAGFGVQLLPMDGGTDRAPPTNTVVLAALTAGDANIPLPPNVEVPVRQENAYAPGNQNFNSNLAVRQPILPTPYTFWEVDLLAAPITVQNLSSTPGTLLVNVYSDNTYVYQQEVTIPPDSYFPVTLGDMALGYISNTPTSTPMPISITMRAEGPDMTAILDTQGPAALRPNHPSYDSVAGFAVQLLPMDGGTGPGAPPTNTVVLAALTSGDASIPLPSNVEVPVRQNIVSAPGSPNFNSSIAIRPPVLPTPYTDWEVELMVAPITVQNNSSTPGTLLVNVYSSNAYVYQQEVTIQPDSYFPVTFAAMALGVVSNTPGAPGMPISITMRAEGANMTAILDTRGPAALRPNLPPYDGITGFAVQLIPMETAAASSNALSQTTGRSSSPTMKTDPAAERILYGATIPAKSDGATRPALEGGAYTAWMLQPPQPPALILTKRIKAVNDYLSEWAPDGLPPLR